MISFRVNMFWRLFFAVFCIMGVFIVSVRGVKGDERGSRARWNVYQNKAFNFRFLVPKDWSVNDQRTHPSILVNLRSPEGANASLAIKVMSSRITLTAFARREVQVLRELGFPLSELKEARVGKEEAFFVGGKHPRQDTGYHLFFFMEGSVGYVLTFTFPIDKAEAEGRLFELVLKTFTFTKRREKERKGKKSER